MDTRTMALNVPDTRWMYFCEANSWDATQQESEIVWTREFMTAMLPWTVDKAPANFLEPDEGTVIGAKRRLRMPARTEKQRRFMGAELERKREGKKTETNMSESELEKMASKPDKKKTSGLSTAPAQPRSAAASTRSGVSRPSVNVAYTARRVSRRPPRSASVEIRHSRIDARSCGIGAANCSAIANARS